MTVFFFLYIFFLIRKERYHLFLKKLDKAFLSLSCSQCLFRMSSSSNVQISSYEFNLRGGLLIGWKAGKGFEGRGKGGLELRNDPCVFIQFSSL